MASLDPQLLFDLLSTPSVTGFEAPGQRVWSSYVANHADRVESDAYGTAWATLDGQAERPRLMLEAHVDEIGFMVQHITDEGFLHIVAVGGSDKAIARARRVHVFGDEGRVTGVIGHTAIHLRNRRNDKVPKWEDLYIDVGASSADEVREQGIRVGHHAVYAEEPEELRDGHIVGRAIDNRLGGYIIAQVLKKLAHAGDRPAATVFAVNSVQEEIGGHGAKMITHRLQPDVALCFDVTHATDTPGVSKAKHGNVKIDGGPTLNHGSANHPVVVQRLIAVAEQHDLPVQHEANSRYTGTDTDKIFNSRSGVPSALISVPLRYMHSPNERISMQDVAHCVDLLTAFVQDVQADEDFAVAL